MADLILPSNIDRDAQLLDLDRVDCEESLYTYFRSAWHAIDAAPWVDGWCMEAIAEHLQAVCYGQIRRLIINISPRCSKSNLVSVAFPTWVWAQPEIGPISGPQVPFLHASYANQLSLRDSVKRRRLIESPWYQKRWGHRYTLTSDQNTKSRFTNDKRGECLITSIDGTNTGEGGMCFVAGTLVSTPDGEIPIESIKAGDSVWSFNFKQMKVVKSRVVATAKRTTSELCELREISGRRFRCTPDHPIYSPGRGFVRADRLGQGERLLINGGQLRLSAQNYIPPKMRYVREANEQAAVRSAQSAQARESGRLLQQEMLLSSSCRKKLPSFLQGLWQRAYSKGKALLLGRMQAGNWQLVQESTSNLWHVWQRISQVWDEQAILLKKMCRRCAFQTDARLGQFQVSSGAWTGGVFKSIPRDAGPSSTERRILLHSLRIPSEKDSPLLSASNFLASSSYRRESPQQSTREPDYPLREVSSFTPYWNASHVSEITHHSGGTHEVYDIQVEGESNFFAEGILVHNCIIIDDPNSVDDVDSEATIQTTIDWWTGTMPTRLNNQETGAYIIIQQRTFENDLTGHILETEGEDWVHLMIPMRYEAERSFFTPIGWKDPRTEQGELMWPERFSETAVKRLETRLGPYRSAGQLQQRPEPAGGGIIKSEWWLKWDRQEYPKNVDFILGVVDTAFTTDELNDPSGMMIWMIYSEDRPYGPTRIVDSSGNSIRPDVTYSEFAPKVLLGYAWDERLELHDLVTKVASTCIRFKVDLLVIENKASGISVAQEIRRLYHRERFGVELFDPKSQDKVARLYSVQHLFAEGIISAPDTVWAERVIKQVGQFPKGAHDEYVDLTSMGLRKLRDMGLLVRQPEREAELEAQKVYPGRQDQPLYPA